MSFSPPPPNVPIHEAPSQWNSQEMYQRHSGGFQKLHSNNPSPSGTPVPILSQTPPPHQQAQDYYQQQSPYKNYYNAGSPPPLQQPYYGELAPQNNSQYPLIVQQQEDMLPHEQDRHILLRFLIGPIRTPIFSYISGIVMAIVLIYEFVRFHQLTGQVIETNPFNPMIGPSFQVLVNVGARFTPCIRPVPSLPPTTLISDCYQSTTDTCTVESMCGFGGFKTPGVADQTFRLVLPIFEHAGVIHYLINMLTHLRLGVDLERSLGTLRFVLLYMASGIWGFVLSAMLSQNLSASTGCSGALFGLIGYMFIDVLVNWKFLPHPVRDLMSLLFSTIISLVLGLLPGLDNFAHIGGFVVGLLMGALIAPMRPMATKKVKTFTWVMRAVALALLIILYTVSIHEFYSATDPSEICPNCKYLSCLPVNNWCDPNV